MNRNLRLASPISARPVMGEHVHARFLSHCDLSTLIELEHEKWHIDQAASEAELIARIDTHPDLAVGAFCPHSGRLLASLFMKPVAEDFHRRMSTWKDCNRAPTPHLSSTLFGISLSSRSQAGVAALLAFFWPYALKRGCRYIYLGSPVPGLRDWMSAHPRGRVEDYVHARRRGVPLDPQLRYYYSRGFKEIVAVKPNYFPHERSLDYGVLLRGTVPLSGLAPLWSALPLASIQRITRPLAAML